jgi:hypothetical protein
MLDLSNAFFARIPTDANGRPDVTLGGAWSVRRAAVGWWDLLRDDGIRLVFRRGNQLSADHDIYVAFGTLPVLRGLAQVPGIIARPARQLFAEATTNGAVRNVLRYWPWWEVSGFVRDAEGAVVAVNNRVVRLVGEGEQILDWATQPPPWDRDSGIWIDAVVGQPPATTNARVTTLHTPSVDTTLAGFDLVTTVTAQADEA